MLAFLGHPHYIVWLMSSDKGVLYLIGGKKIKMKVYLLILVGGKNKKEVRNGLLLVKMNKVHNDLGSF